jgi:hypothetical protein
MTHFLPTMPVNYCTKHRFEGDAVQGIVWMRRRIGHVEQS